MSNRRRARFDGGQADGIWRGSMQLLLSREARRFCSACGSDRIEWLGLGDALEVLGPTTVDEFIESFQSAGIRIGPTTELDFWRCALCGHCGCFGPEA